MDVKSLFAVLNRKKQDGSMSGYGDVLLGNGWFLVPRSKRKP
ncbi:hypothetical protein Z946_3468 [Sulfitobacter noctilucicola]|nr:hypothetical protein Z946_3468 [Sulfitobacter noctilucicola]